MRKDIVGTPSFWSITMNATAHNTIESLTALSQRAADLAAALPELDLPADQLAEALAQVRRLDVRLALIEEGLASLGPVVACSGTAPGG
jgi:hypothetical protein